MTIKKKIIWASIVAIAHLFHLNGEEGGKLSLRDVGPTMKEMFSYHVEQRSFSPTIARRSVRIFIEQFDSSYSYLLQGEVEPFLTLEPLAIDQIITSYREETFSFYKRIYQTIENAVQRHRKILDKSIQSLLDSPINLELPPPLLETTYPKNLADLEKGISHQVLHYVYQTVKRRNIENPSRETIEKILFYYKKKQIERENVYLGLSPQDREHVFAFQLLKAFAKSLDAHSGYYSPEEASRIRVALKKEFLGVGIVLQEDFDAVYISKLVAGGPADEEGTIQSGDQLVTIDYQNIRGLSFSEVLERLSGPRGSTLVLGIKRDSLPGGLPKHVSLTRRKMVMNDQRLVFSTEPFGDGMIGKITIPSFYDNGKDISVERDLRRSIRELQGRGNLLGLVIDLRENSGGFLRQAIKVSELFIDKGIIVISKYSQGKMSYAANLKENAFYKGPLVLLLSKASASAAEIFAQALQDYGVALIAGDDRSYGKGSMQHQTLTDPSARFFFKVTVGRYYTASGRSPQIQGVQTDIAVPTRYFPYRIGERYLAFPLAKDHLSFDLFQALKKVRQGGDSIFPSLLVPYLKPRESKWRKMLPTLMANSSKRITKDLNFQLFLTKGKLLQMQRGRELFSPETSVGQGDLQMEEALMIVKDIISIDQKNRSTLSTK